MFDNQNHGLINMIGQEEEKSGCVLYEKNTPIRQMKPEELEEIKNIREE